jgi:hypothetical protein
MHPMEEPFRSVRIEELRRLEMCERALAQAYRRLARRRSGNESIVLHSIATLGEKHAELLRDRVEALGGQCDSATDEAWLVGDCLSDAEDLAIACYHDHMGDHDDQTMAMIREQILPHHRAARDYLERDSPVPRESEL